MKDRKMKGLSPQPDRVLDYTSVVKLDDLQYDLYTSAKYFKINEVGEVVVKTLAELEADQVAEAKESARTEAKQVRDEGLDSLAVEINGNSIQVRPKDEVNIRLSLGVLEPLESTEWVLSDNTVATVTREDLEAAYGLGLQLAQEIYDDYKAVLKGV